MTESQPIFEAAIKVDPGYALPQALLARQKFLLLRLGVAKDPVATIAHEEKARRLYPYDPVVWAFLTTQAAGLVCRGVESDLEAAEERSREAILANTKVWHPAAIAALSATRRGDHDTAQKLVQRAKETLPVFSASMIRQSLGKGAQTEPWSSIAAMVEDMRLP